MISYFTRVLLVLSAFGVLSFSVYASTSSPAYISNVQAVNIMGPGAQIVWTTDVPSDSFVYYGTAPGAYVESSSARCDGGGMVTSHCVNLTNLSYATPYYYKVRSTNQAGYPSEQGGYSFTSGTEMGMYSSAANSSSTTTTSTTSSGTGGSTSASSALPTPPGSVSATPVSSTRIDLTFTAGTGNTISGYKIYRDSTYVGSTSATNYSDNSLLPKTFYSYHVRSVDTLGSESPASLTVGASTFADTSTPQMPSGFSGYFVSKGTYGPSVNLFWQDTANEESYKLWERPAGGSWLLKQTYSVNTASVQVAGYSAGTYDYKLEACNANGCSSDSQLTVTMGEMSSNTSTTTNASINTTTASSATAVSFSVDTTTRVGDMTAPSITAVETKNIMGSGAQIVWTTDVPSDSQVIYGTKSDTDEPYPRISTYRCDSGGMVRSHCVNLKNLAYGIKYFYKVISRNEKGFLAMSAEYVFVSGASSTTTTAFPHDTSTAYVSEKVVISVTREASYCNGLVGVTPIKFSAIPASGAYFRITNEGGGSSKEVGSGIHVLPNGSYHWRAIAHANAYVPQNAEGDFVLEQSCANVATSGATLKPTTTLFATAPNLLPTGEKESGAFITLNSGEIVRISYKGIYREAGARGFYGVGMQAGEPTRVSEVPDTSIPGIYKLTYQLRDGTGVIVASAVRTVIVEMPQKTVTAEEERRWQEDWEKENERWREATSTMGPEFALREPLPPSPMDVRTSRQYAYYCDDPLHRKECEEFASQKITISAVQPSLISEQEVAEKFDVLKPQANELLVQSSNPQELRAICSQSQYATRCADLFVNAGMLNREQAQQQVKELFAAKEEISRMITERVGARMFQDTDNDGITDFDEINIYRTDPKKSDTNNDGILDGAHLIAGTDPLATVELLTQGTSEQASTKNASIQPVAIGTLPVAERKIAYENPKFAGEAKPEILKVTDVKAAGLESTELAAPKITLSGLTLPNSFVTLFIFSDPIVVTVRADENGLWTYTLDKELSDGSHEVLSAITDSGGRILAKSEPLPFVKTAAAVSVGSPLLISENQKPGFFTGAFLYIFTAVLLTVLGVAFVSIGWVAKNTNVPPVNQ